MARPTEPRVLILGRGAMGSMFKGLLDDRAHVTTWDRDPENGQESARLETLAPGQRMESWIATRFAGFGTAK